MPLSQPNHLIFILMDEVIVRGLRRTPPPCTAGLRIGPVEVSAQRSTAAEHATLRVARDDNATAQLLVVRLRVPIRIPAEDLTAGARL